jgi:hypothetical protein
VGTSQAYRHSLKESTMAAIPYDYSCSFRIDGDQWMLRISPSFIDISCPVLSISASIDVSTADGGAITYEENQGYTCGAAATEAVFKASDGTTMHVIRHIYLNPEETSNTQSLHSRVEISTGNMRCRIPIPFVIARAVSYIAEGQQDAVRDLGAYLIRVT